MTTKIALAFALVAFFATASVAPANAQFLATWGPRLAWGAAGWGLSNLYHRYRYGPPIGYGYPPPWRRGYYGPHYAYGGPPPWARGW
jgi:hypothetical protein